MISNARITLLLHSTSIYKYVIDRETPLAKIVGQMSLSRNTDVPIYKYILEHLTMNTFLSIFVGLRTLTFV